MNRRSSDIGSITDRISTNLIYKVTLPETGELSLISIVQVRSELLSRGYMPIPGSKTRYKHTVNGNTATIRTFHDLDLA